MNKRLTFTATTEVDSDTRAFEGVAVPYAEVTRDGRKVAFRQGSFGDVNDLALVGLYVQHPMANEQKAIRVGRVSEWRDTDDGLAFSAQLNDSDEATEVYAALKDGSISEVSVEVYISESEIEGDTEVFTSVEALELSLITNGESAFAGSKISAVFNAEKPTKEIKMENENTVEAATPDYSAITDAIRGGFESLATPQREVVSTSAGQSATFVSEPTPYRFDGLRGEQSFVEDMRAAQQGNSDATRRLATFSSEFSKAQFAVSTSNTSTLNPVQNRPDLFVPNLTYTRPLWESVSTGSITDKTSFTVPKFGSASGLVGPHTEGVEPTPGAFSATSQTVQPTALSGKVEINREVLDQGGSPQVDQIIWGEMLNAWYEGLEGRVAASLAGVSTAELNLNGATNAALVDQMTNYLASLQFVRGGNRYTQLALDGTLFPALINAADGDGRKLLPVLGASNAQGTAGAGFDNVQIGSQTGRAAWALGSGNTARSYSFVPSSVWAWASAPQRFTFEYQVKSVDVAIWGYAASAVLRDSDVKPIDYTASDAA